MCKLTSSIHTAIILGIASSTVIADEPLAFLCRLDAIPGAKCILISALLVINIYMQRLYYDTIDGGVPYTNMHSFHFSQVCVDVFCYPDSFMLFSILKLPLVLVEDISRPPLVSELIKFHRIINSTPAIMYIPSFVDFFLVALFLFLHYSKLFKIILM